MPTSFHLDEMQVNYWPKITFDPTNIFLEDKMVESGIKLSHLCGSRGNLSGFLTSTQYHLLA